MGGFLAPEIDGLSLIDSSFCILWWVADPDAVRGLDAGGAH